MSADRRRGLPEDAKPRKTTAKVPGRKRRRGLIRTLVRIVVAAVLAVGIGTTLFIATRCYSGTASNAAPLPPIAADGISGYARAKVFTYLTVPEWYIVYSADEFATVVQQRPPSSFPFLGSVRQYWGFYSAVCSATKGRYTFETGYHAMLGIIGASFTIENAIKWAYENSVGRMTETLSSTDTAEDAFARRVAQEYGTFMHTVPWYQFPFAARLAEFWRDTPLRGRHLLRKLERRFALTAEYGAKAIYGWIIGQASGAAYAAEDLRIHARIENATPAVFKDTRVRQVKALGAGSYLITLPRYEEFTKAALALSAQGVRFVDIAGNGEIVATVVTRRAASHAVPQATLIATVPILTDPTMERLAFSIPVSALREVSEHLARERTAIEHLYDY